MYKQASHTEYLRRVHIVEDYIEQHMDCPLPLSALAKAAGFSPYHFHRIFHALTGETLTKRVNRIRLERAAAYLLHNPRVTVTEIAHHYGFADSAVFSRLFKQHYGVSPTAYRRQHRKNCKAQSDRIPYDEPVPEKQNRRDSTMMQASNVEMKTVDMRVIYTRFTGSYSELAQAMPEMMQKIYQFAVKRQLLDSANTKILSAYHDNPEFTDAEKLRVSLCMSVPKDANIELEGDIGIMTISGSFGVGHFELLQTDYPAAWQAMYGQWLPGSGLQPRDAFPFEVYVSDPSKNPGGKQLLDIYVPVEPLGTI